MKMTNDVSNALLQIHNTLSAIATAGENTVKMASCLTALRVLLKESKVLEEEPEDCTEGAAE